MPNFLNALQGGAAHLWVFLPTAVLLGALHGLEPGHSKTMMAAFIIAIRGTVRQAVLLGLSAAVSHSLIIWILAALALQFGHRWDAGTVEPYLQLGSAVFILALAGWMWIRTRRDLRAAASHEGGPHHHHHEHAHGERFVLDLGHGTLELSVFEEGVPPVFRLRAPAGETLPAAPDVTIETQRPEGTRQTFRLIAKEDFLESREAIPEPHEFDVVVTIGHGGHTHSCRVEFREGDHSHYPAGGEGPAFADAHERAHARDIEQRFTGRAVTTPQIVLFGITVD